MPFAQSTVCSAYEMQQTCLENNQREGWEEMKRGGKYEFAVF
jgi:hypothetical protein